MTQSIKAASQSQDLVDDRDFMNLVIYVMGYCQNRNWDPEVNDLTFHYHCENTRRRTYCGQPLVSTPPPSPLPSRRATSLRKPAH